jgi:hypothetical protein
MLALEPARNAQLTRPVVILSAAHRLLTLPEIAPLRFPSSGESHLFAANVNHLPQKGHQQDALFAGDGDELRGGKKVELSPVNKVPQRSRRISLRSRRSSRAQVLPLRANCRRMRTYTIAKLSPLECALAQNIRGGGFARKSPARTLRFTVRSGFLMRLRLVPFDSRLPAGPKSCRMCTYRKRGPLWGAQKSTNRMSFCALTKSGGPTRAAARGGSSRARAAST